MAGFALLNNSGLREYEAMDRPDRPLAITLLRAFTYRNSPVFGRWETYPDMELAQCIGKFEWTYAIYPHEGDWTQGVFAQAEDHNLPLEVAQVGPHEGTLPKQQSFLEVQGDNLQLTTFKRAERDENAFVVRLFNPTNKVVNGKIKLFNKVKSAALVNMNEEHPEKLTVRGDAIALKVAKKKIVTVLFEL